MSLLLSVRFFLGLGSASAGSPLIDRFFPWSLNLKSVSHFGNCSDCEESSVKKSNYVSSCEYTAGEFWLFFMETRAMVSSYSSLCLGHVLGHLCLFLCSYLLLSKKFIPQAKNFLTNIF